MLSRMLQSLGEALNSRSSIKSWNVFGDSMSAFVCLIAIGCASGVEVFDYIWFCMLDEIMWIKINEYILHIYLLLDNLWWCLWSLNLPKLF